MPKATRAGGQRTVNQHYVPQFYLRRFTNASGNLFCYDKVADKSHPTTTRAAAQEANFYEIAPGPSGEWQIPVNTVERFLGRAEAAWAPLLADLVRCADEGTITAGKLLQHSPFVVIQWLRTKTHRDTLFEIVRKSGQAIVDDLVELNFPESVGRVHFELNPQGMAGLQAAQLFDPELIEQMADDLDRHIWTVGVNGTGRAFYTSDPPFVRRANCWIGGDPLVGVRDPGVEFVFPLDSTHVLLILERTHFATWKAHDNRAIRLTESQVMDYNRLQVRRSCRRVFCAADDFGLAIETCRADPAIRDPDRPRVRVDRTPVVHMKSYQFVTALE